ncbi:voltage-gated chloride channel, partial [bacterium]
LGLFKKASDSIKIWKPLKGVLGGIALIVITLLLSPKYLGLGLDTVSDSLADKSIDWYAFLAKIVTTSITLNFGGSGGILTPIFFIGSTAGTFFASIFSLPSGIFAAIGLVALLSGAANTPIAACIMAIEMFGTDITSYAAVACVVSFMMSGHRSVFPSQQISFTKSSSINIDSDIQDNKEIILIKPYFMPKRKVFIKIVNRFNDKPKDD